MLKKIIIIMIFGLALDIPVQAMCSCIDKFDIYDPVSDLFREANDHDHAEVKKNKNKRLKIIAGAVVAIAVVVGGAYLVKNYMSSEATLDEFAKELKKIKDSCVGAGNDKLQQEYDLIGKKIADFDVNDKNLERQIELRKWKREQARVWDNKSDIKIFDTEIKIIKDGIDAGTGADDVFLQLRMQSESGCW